MLRFFGVDLLGVFRGEMSWRRLGSLIDHLPDGSQTVAAIRRTLPEAALRDLADRADPEAGVWSRDQLLLADIFDGVRILAWQQSGGSAPAPEPFPRPGVGLRLPQIAPHQARYLERLRGRQADG